MVLFYRNPLNLTHFLLGADCNRDHCNDVTKFFGDDSIYDEAKAFDKILPKLCSLEDLEFHLYCFIASGYGSSAPTNSLLSEAKQIVLDWPRVYAKDVSSFLLYS